MAAGSAEDEDVVAEVIRRYVLSGTHIALRMHSILKGCPDVTISVEKTDPVGHLDVLSALGAKLGLVEKHDHDAV